MSSSDRPTALDIWDRAAGVGVFQAIGQGLAGVFIALGVSIIAGVQTVVDFILLPFFLFIDVAEASVQGFFIGPILGIEDAPGLGDVPGLIPVGLAETANALIGRGLAALPIATTEALGLLLLVLGFLALGFTSNVIPGLGVDNPLWDRVFGTPEEEFDEED